ncbi:LacI family DNA-binding transcriptional regulator [Paenibacillus antri]|nr:LacI family DNA-binding transcriptional regulator [Paenibacillus antri]
MPRKVSIQTIADQLGLSKYAVSRALSGKSGVSQATRERVLKLAETLGYGLPAQKAKPPASGTASFVLVCINQSNRGDPSYWQRVLEGIIAGCREKGWQHAIVSQPLSFPKGSALSPQETIAPHLDWNGCLGLVVLGAYPYSALQLMARTGKPLVLLDHNEPMLDCDAVNHANIDAGMTVAHHLIAARRCRSIVYLGDDGRSTSFSERRIGVRIAAERYGDERTKLREWELPYEEGGWLEEAQARFERLAPEERPDGWICANDDIAIRWMRKLQELGVSIPEQTLVTGIDNVEGAAHASPRLTTVNLCKEELGARAVEALQRRIERPGSPAERIQLRSAFIPRDSA